MYTYTSKTKVWVGRLHVFFWADTLFAPHAFNQLVYCETCRLLRATHRFVPGSVAQSRFRTLHPERLSRRETVPSVPVLGRNRGAEDAKPLSFLLLDVGVHLEFGRASPPRRRALDTAANPAQANLALSQCDVKREIQYSCNLHGVRQLWLLDRQAMFQPFRRAVQYVTPTLDDFFVQCA